jgi:hypothetical protein
MLYALFDILKAALGFLTVLTIWLAIQAFARRRSGCGRDRDMLEFMLNGCGGCANRENCGNRKKGKAS